METSNMKQGHVQQQKRVLLNSSKKRRKRKTTNNDPLKLFIIGAIGIFVSKRYFKNISTTVFYVLMSNNV